jgi:YfiH family protein
MPLSDTVTTSPLPGRGERLLVEGGCWSLRWTAPAGIAGGVIGRPVADDAAAVGLTPPGPAARVDQVHGVHVVTVDAAGPAGAADALVTAVPGLALQVCVADCLPVLLAGPNGVAAIHAGWRGAAGGIVTAALDRLTALGGDPPGTIAAWIGPAIGTCCFEVGDEVATAFPRAFRRAGPRRAHVDLAAVVAAELRAAGVPDTAIARTRYCTRCHQHLWHSHRGSGGGPGRLVAWIRRGGQIDSSVDR